MEIIKKEVTRTVTDTITKYRAIDGTEFHTEEECTRYEGTVEAVLLSKILAFQIKEIPGDDLFESNSEGIYRIVIPECEAHIDTLNQLWKLNGGQNTNTLLFSTEDIGTIIAVGIREYAGKIDWIWFWKVAKVMEQITDDKYTLKVKV